MIRAIVRAVPQSFASALSAAPPDPGIDVALARAQHEAYRAALAACGARVETLAADDASPDCCFVEDRAVVIDGVALITRSATPSRSAESAAVAVALRRDHDLVHMPAPATCDGGDVLRAGRTLYVGRSARTNQEGIAQLARAFPRLRVVAVDLPAGVLHLKCVCSPLGPDRIVLAEGTIPAETFDDVSAVSIPAAESYAANVVVIGRHAVVADGYPRTHEALARAGLTLHPVAVTEARKADGSLTCQSILLYSPAP